MHPRPVHTEVCMVPRPVSHIPTALRRLTPRQREIMRLVAMGYTYAETAHHMGLAIGTVKIQMHEARVRLDVSRTIDAFSVLGWLRVPA